MKSARNKTIDFDKKSDEYKEFSKKSLKLKRKSKAEDIVNHVINGDFFDVVKKLPKNFIDLAIIDPPYNIYKNYHGHIFNEKKQDEYLEFTRKYLEFIIPLLKDNASVYICCDWKSSIIISSVISDYFNIQNRITWQREKGRGSKYNYKNSMEDIWFLTRSNNYTFNVNDIKTRKKVIAPYKVNGKPKDWVEGETGKYRDTHPSNIFTDITIPYWSMPENTAHPTQKPEKLMAKLILASSNEGDIIFDPFSGAGTTLVTAKKLNRKFLGIEKNELYCAWTNYRLKLADEFKNIQGYKNGVFYERNTFGEK